MKKIALFIFNMILISIINISCEDMMGDYLEKAPGVDVSEDTIFSSRTQLETFVAGIYQFGIHSNLGYAARVTDPYTRKYANEDENIYAGAADEAETCADWYRMNWWNSGIVSASNTDDTRFTFRYMAIRRVSILLDRIHEVPDLSPAYRDQLIAESKVIRALNYFEMMKRYGGMPIIDDRLQVDADLMIPRSPLKKMLEFMLKDINEAQPHLLVKATGNLRGRVDLGTALALKSKILLYAASPLYNTNRPYLDFGEYNNLICLGEPYNSQLWIDAAAAAEECLRWCTQNGYHLIADQGADKNYQYSWEIYDNQEIILAEKSSTAMPVWNRPWSGIIPSSIYAGSSGTNGTTPLLNFVEKYEDRDGNKVDWSGGDDLQAKMASLDYRFHQTIAYNMSWWNEQHPEIQIWEEDAANGISPGKHVNMCYGGFWLHKLVAPSITRPGNDNPVPNSTLFQVNEIYLNFAEAMFEVYGADNSSSHSMTARQAINIIRERSGQPPVKDSQYGNDFREVIRNERAIELAFDNHRFWDIRRWMIAEQEGVMTGEARGIKIYWIPGVSPAEFRYTPYRKETRTFIKRMYMHPFPTNEVNKGYLVQNPGY